MKAKFYLKDLEEEFGETLPDRRLVFSKRVVPDVLFFSMSRPALGDSSAPDHSFDGKATEQHVQQYGEAYRQFKLAHPDFKLQWPELDFKVEAPVVAKAKADAPKKKK